MRTVCPSCQAAYDVPEAVLASGRTLRCARCGANFTPEAPAPAASVATPGIADSPPVLAAAPTAPAPAERLVSPVAAQEPDAWSGTRPAVVAGWVVSLLVLVAMGWAFVAWRGAIERAWPASGRVYAVLGLE